MPKFRTYVENQRWLRSSLLFFTLHVVGSNNNFEAGDPNAVAEYFDREKANIAWIQDSFQVASAKKVEAVILCFQGNVFETRSQNKDFPEHSGYRKTIYNTLFFISHT